MQDFLKQKKLSRKNHECFYRRHRRELYDDMIEALILSDIPFQTAERIMEDSKNVLRKMLCPIWIPLRKPCGKALLLSLKKGSRLRGFNPLQWCWLWG